MKFQFHALLVALLTTTAAAEYWPTFMHDRSRSGVSGEVLSLPLNELWSYTPPAEPVRAWPNPQPGFNELPKLAFDDATHVAMVGDTVFFGSAVMKPGPKGMVPWAVPPNGACGQMSASAGMLFYRDGYTVMRDAGTGATLMNFTGMRPGCLINIIPAGGVIVQVEASSGCTCYHAIQSTVAFVPPGAE